MKKLLFIFLFSMLFGGTNIYASPSLYDRAIDEMSIVPKGALDNAKQAITNRNTLRVAFIGDSITEGTDNTDPSDAYVAKVIDLLQTSLPNVNVISQNFGIAGTFTMMFNYPTYVGLSTPSSDPNAGFIKPWSVVGKTWQETVRDFNPDLLFVAFGMNDASANYSYTDSWSAGELNKLVDTVQAWPSHPSIVIVPTILPTKNLNNYPQRQDVTMSVARSHRLVAKERKLSVADANRLFSILRDGQDSVSTSTYTEKDWTNYSSNWSGGTSYFTLYSNKLVPNSNAYDQFITRNRPFYNGTIDLDIIPAADGDSGTTWINYRESDLGKMTVIVGSGNGNGYVRLYSYDPTSSYTYVSDANNLNIPVGSISHIMIQVKDNEHIISLNGTKIIDAKTYASLNDGNVSLGVNEIPSTMENLSIKYHDPLIEQPYYSEQDLLGIVGSGGNGNGKNHPTSLGSTLVYLPAFYGIIKELAR